MANTARRGFIRFLIPGFVFQSILIAGGYGTGAEICQYFGSSGLVGGLMGALVTTLLWAVLCAVSFEFARVFRTFDYNSMMMKLIGRIGVLFEISYVVLLLIVLGVVNATAGSMIREFADVSPWIGIFILNAAILLLVIKGTEAIENALTFWSVVLYAVYIVFMLIVFSRFGSNVATELAKEEVKSGWFVKGCQYAFYNVACVPAFLYTIRDAKSRGEAVACGIIAGFIGVIPAAVLLLAMGSNLAEVVANEVPITVIFKMINMPVFYLIFDIVLFGTLIETGAGFIKGVVDRIEVTYAGKGSGTMPAWLRPLVSVALVIVGICVSTFGLIGLIARGYGTICWVFLLIYALPMVTIGIYKISKAK